MKLNHVALTVTDVQAASEFLQRYFSLKPLGKANPTMMHLKDDDGLILSLFRAGLHSSKISEPASTHIGFMQASESEVNAIYRRLAEDGFEVEPPQRSHGLIFTVVAPGGFAVEVVS